MGTTRRRDPRAVKREAAARNTRAGRRGFSLLELILIVAIIVTLGAIAAPRYANATNRYRAEAAARRVAADLAQAATTGRAASADITVTFNVLNDDYVLSGVGNLKKTASNTTVTLSEEPYRVDLQVALFGGDNVVIFDGYGMPDSGGNVVISCGGFQSSVNLDGQTGKAVSQMQ